ncbi:MAG TPA: tetratricopeptide repeat protein, partial [Blastocatellia bacterium]|nr:tetratricopeptide repeat protein [Blastocatellia bacterium]
MRPGILFRRACFAALCLICLDIVAEAQFGIRGQIFLPNGAPVQKRIRFMLTTENGTRTEYFYTDSNGRIALPQINSPYRITVESDGEMYDTTTATFIPPHSGNYIIVNLSPLSSKPNPAPGLVDASAVEEDVNPKAREAYLSGIRHIEAEEYDQAIEQLKKALSIQPDFFNAYNDLGALYMKLNRLDEAVDALNHAIKINRSIYLPHLNLGIAYNRQRKFKEAAEVLTRLKRNHPNDARVHAPLIEALIGNKQWTEAEQAIVRSLATREFDPVDLKVKLGLIRLRQGNYDAAATVLREAIAEQPEHALAHFNLGAVLFQTGKLDEAESELLRAYSLRGARMAGAQLLLGQLYYQKQ